MKCAHCGNTIRKKTTTVYLEKERSKLHQTGTGSRYVYPSELGVPWPETVADCQKLSNQKVTSIRRGSVWNQDLDIITKGKAVHCFHEWDGESYAPSYRYFCSNNCAAWHGVKLVEALRARKRA